MSTVRANQFLDAAGGNTATINGMTPTAQSLQGFRNRIINGNMLIDQRNAGASVTVNSASRVYSLDRWFGFGQAADGVFTVQQSTDAPSGFTNSSTVTVTTADASIGTSQIYGFGQTIEGFNTADLGFGTASASTITVSFWVKSSLTGTFGAALNNSGDNRSYPFSYTINSANTWEQKFVTIAGDTSGTWLTNNGTGITVFFGLGVGSNFLGTTGSWVGASRYGATGQTQVMSTLNATWRVTGVQLEAGSVATPFERRPFGTELALCQRYCIAQTGAQSLPARGTSTTSVQAGFPTPVAMRAAPSITASVAATAYGVSGAAAATSTLSIANYYPTGLQIGAAGFSGISDDRTAALTITGAFVLSAEL
jgi:hypothetical protein